jgi:hypothetical protein
MLLAALVGWLDRPQQDALAYLIEENRILRGHVRGRIPYCPSARPGRRSRRAIVIVEQPAEVRTPTNATNDGARRRHTRDQRVLQALVIALISLSGDAEPAIGHDDAIASRRLKANGLR